MAEFVIRGQRVVVEDNYAALVLVIQDLIDILAELKRELRK